MGILDGKVAIVTGGGNGIGREHCLALAAAGAKVVVNDLGQDVNGAGEATSVADKVVATIVEAGGEAVANYDSVATWDGASAIIETAKTAFGRLDILVNNAGILRDKTLLKMTEEMWDPVVDVHMKGTFLCTRFAALLMREQGEGGRIISTSSLAGLKGNMGQTNYGAAKAGVFGMTRVWSMELARYNITANAIAPVALTRMTENLGVVPDDMTPDKVSPVIVFLASDLASHVNGRTFGVHGNEIFEYRMEQTPSLNRDGGTWTAAEIAERLPELDKKPEAAAAGGGVDDQVSGVFAALPEAFRAARAGDWKAVLHFVVGESGSHTLTIADGSCSHEAGTVGSATCVVTFDAAATLVGMIQGTVKPEQAFMSGKLKASSMGDLMKFGKVFDFKRAAALAADAIAGTGKEAGPSARIGELFQNIGLAFRADRAGDWSAILHFEVVGAGDWSVKIADGSVEAIEGKPGHADCVITFESAELFLDLTAGKIKPEGAFMAGKIKASNMGALMKFAKSFDLRKAAEAVNASQASAADSSSGPAPVGLNKALVGRKYRQGAIFAEPAHTVAYAQATNDENPRYLDESADGGQIAPPMFAVRGLHGALHAVVADADLNVDLLNLVHGEQDLRFLAPIRPWDLLAPRSEISSIDDKSSGQLLTIGSALMRDGFPVVEASSGLFIRDRTKLGGGKRPATEEAAPTILWTSDETVAADQPIRYAAASLDNNPIHLDPAVAAAAGHPSVILHGLCTMAFAQKAIVNEALGGDPTGLRRLKARFTAVVLPGQVLTTRVWKMSAADGVTTLGFETVNGDGKPVIRSGLAEVSTSSLTASD